MRGLCITIEKLRADAVKAEAAIPDILAGMVQPTGVPVEQAVERQTAIANAARMQADRWAALLN